MFKRNGQFLSRPSVSEGRTVEVTLETGANDVNSEYEIGLTARSQLRGMSEALNWAQPNPDLQTPVHLPNTMVMHLVELFAAAEVVPFHDEALEDADGVQMHTRFAMFEPVLVQISG